MGAQATNLVNYRTAPFQLGYDASQHGAFPAAVGADHAYTYAPPDVAENALHFRIEHLIQPSISV